MRAFIIAAAFLLLCTAPVAAQIRVGQPVPAEWDYDQAQIDCKYGDPPIECEGGPVTRFEYKLDTGEWIDTGLPALPPGKYEFIVPKGSATKGVHDFRVRACNTVLCGDGAMATYKVEALVPSKPRNLTIRVPAVALNIPQTRELADSYTYALRLSRLTDAELWALARLYDGPLPPTHESVLAFLDARASDIAK